MSLHAHITASRRLSTWIDAKLDGTPVPATLRSRLAVGSLHQALEHQRAIALLARNNLNGTAFACVRLLFEAYVRGVWLHQCAQEKELVKFQKDKLEKSFGELLTEVERLEAFAEGVLSGIKNRSWKVMNSFTHTGFGQVVRRLTADSVQASYDESEVRDALSFSNAVSLLAAIEVAHLAGNTALALVILTRAKRLSPSAA